MRSLTIVTPWLAVPVLAVFLGCGEEPNKLYGSISEIYDLSFDEVKVSKQADYLVVEYLKSSGKADSVGKTAKLIANLQGLVVEKDREIDLAEKVGNVTRGTIQRIGTATVDFGVAKGVLILHTGLETGKPVSGHFATTVVDPMGRTLNGDFDGKLVEVTIQ